MKHIEERTIPVMLSIRGEQFYDGVEPDATELMTEGALTETEDGFRITYEETELTGMEGCTTTFEIKGKQVILTRTGRLSSQMVFEEGKQHTSLYQTAFGNLTVDISTNYLRHTITVRGGLLAISYSIAVGHTAKGRNGFKIRVREKKN